jgi:hypothetical protein
MGNKLLFQILIWVTLVMIMLTTVLFIWTFVRVSNGSNIKDVRNIVILMIVTSVAAFVVILDGLFLMH